MKVRFVVSQVRLETGSEAIEASEAVAHLKYVVEVAHGALQASLVLFSLQGLTGAELGHHWM